MEHGKCGMGKITLARVYFITMKINITLFMLSENVDKKYRITLTIIHSQTYFIFKDKRIKFDMK